MFRTLLCCVLASLSWSGSAQSQSPYVGQELREIKAMSPQEISDYLSGKGMGLAKAAELNGFPGPAYVLELATQLNLTTDQKIKTEALFKKGGSSRDPTRQRTCRGGTRIEPSF